MQAPWPQSLGRGKSPWLQALQRQVVTNLALAAAGKNTNGVTDPMDKKGHCSHTPTMANDEIAALFKNMVSLLQATRGNVFKIRAYHKPALSFRKLMFSLETAVPQGHDSRSIPGVGDVISRKIYEYFSTGRIEAYENLKREFR